MFETRYIVMTMMFLTCFAVYMVKSNISIILVAMVENKNKTLPPPPDYGPRFNWKEQNQSDILVSFYYGYATSNLLGGTLAEQFGGRNVVGITLLIGGVLSMLQPAFAGRFTQPIIILRSLIGLVMGLAIPACYTLISKWAPPIEKGKFIAALIMGGTMGLIMTLPMTTLIIYYIDWRAAFYLEGLYCIGIGVIWFIIVTDDPNKHWFINPNEINYIADSLQTTITSVKNIPPYLKIFSSIPCLALLALHAGTIWGVTLLLNYVPKYMSQILNFNLNETGIITTLPNLARFVMAFIFGIIIDIIRQRELLSITVSRKVFCVISHILPGLLLFAIGLWADEPWKAVLLLTLSSGLTGSAVATNFQNPQDLAPNYAGTLFGIMNFFGQIAGILGTMLVGRITKDKSTQEEWSHIFYIGGAIYIVTAIIFILLGTGETQKWNFPKTLKDENSIGENLKDANLKDVKA